MITKGAWNARSKECLTEKDEGQIPRTFSQKRQQEFHYRHQEFEQKRKDKIQRAQAEKQAKEK